MKPKVKQNGNIGISKFHVTNYINNTDIIFAKAQEQSAKGQI